MRGGEKIARAVRWVRALLGAAVGGGVAWAVEPVTFSGHAMGTGWTVTCVASDVTLESEALEREIVERLERIEQIFSTYRPQSEVSRFNAVNTLEWFPVSPEMAQVASESAKISVLTGGAFDATVFPLVQLWGFGAMRRSDAAPTAAEVSAVRALVDWRQLEVRLSPPALRKARPRLSADFSSMAKGFAADAVSDLLDGHGARNHFVQVGGDIRTAGCGIDGGAWHAGIEQPLENANAVTCVLRLHGQALSTSGDYRNFFRVGRLRYGHIVDPRTGQPPTSSLASVSVVHASCAQSSAWATGLFVLGPDEGYRVAVREGLACLFLVRRGAALVRIATPGFERFVARQD